MSINTKKYTKDQMAKMVEEAAERLESLKFENSTLTEQLKSQTAKTCVSIKTFKSEMVLILL